MRITPRLRRLFIHVGAGLVLASLPPAALAAGNAARASASAPVVHGLIVQLRDAPSHVALAQARERAQALGIAAPAPLPEAARWQRLLADWRADADVLRELPQWAGAAPQRDPVGASAQLLRFAKPLSAEQAERVAARIAARPEVAWVSTNTREQRQAVSLNPPQDPYFPNSTGQWWLHPVSGSNGNAIVDRLRGVAGFQTAWQNGSNGDAAAVVAVLDSGITCHPDLGNGGPLCTGGAILPGYDFVSDASYANDGDGRDADPRDPGDWVSAADRTADPARYANCDLENSSWHGSIIAGLIAAQTNNGIGAAGINWHGRILPVRVAGKCGADVRDIVDGMRWAAGLDVCNRFDDAGICTDFAPRNQYPARIINISFGGSAACSNAYQQAIEDVRAVGAVIVAAAGNGWGAPSRPANCQHVIGVAALNRDGFKATYSNFGAVLAIATAGGDDDDGAWGKLLGASRLDDSGVLSIGNSALTAPADCAAPGANCYFNHYGTSFSAPIVSGALSLMLSVNPALTASQLEQGLARSARPHLASSVTGFGTCGDANPGRCLCTTGTCGAGILDAAQALLYAANPAGYVNTRSADVIDTPELRAAVASGQPDRPANVVVPPPATGGGGGAMNAAWLLGLALASAALAFSARPRPAPRRKARIPRPMQRH